MKKLITLLLLFTLVGFLSGNQVVITNDYEYIVSEGKTYNFNNGSESNNVKYDRTNKIAIQNNKIIADPLKYHYAFFWDEADSFIGYYKTNKGITTSGEYLGQVNTQSIPLPLNAYSFALVRYDNDYVLVNGFTIEELFIDNNLADVDPDDFNDIPIAELNGLTLNELFVDGQEIVNNDFTNFGTGWTNPFGGLQTTTFNGQTALITSVATGARGILQSVLTLNANYYLRVSVKPSSNLNLFIGNTSINYSLTPGVFNTVSRLYNPGTDSNYRVYMNSTSIGDTLEIDFANAYNLTALGISSLTKAQLDTYFSIYQNGVNATYYATDGNVSSVDGYYYASGKNLFDPSQTEIGSLSVVTGLPATSLIDIRSSEFTNIKPSTTYFYSSFNSSIIIQRIFYYDINVST
jgi:hypothetical protein